MRLKWIFCSATKPGKKPPFFINQSHRKKPCTTSSQTVFIFRIFSLYKKVHMFMYVCRSFLNSLIKVLFICLHSRISKKIHFHSNSWNVLKLKFFFQFSTTGHLLQIYSKVRIRFFFYSDSTSQWVGFMRFVKKD